MCNVGILKGMWEWAKERLTIVELKQTLFCVLY